MRIFLIDRQDLPRFAGLYEQDFPARVDGKTLLLGAVDEQAQPARAAGLLAARVEDDLLMLDWLYVAPDCRRKGAASALCDRLFETAIREGTLTGAAAPVAQEQDDLIAFFEALGFCIYLREGCGIFRAKLGDLTGLPAYPAGEYHVLPLGEAPAASLRAFNGRLVNGAAANCGVPLPIRPEDYAKQSMVCCTANGAVCGVLLLKVRGGAVEISWLYAERGRERALPLLLGAASKRMNEMLPPETPLVFGTLGQSGAVLAARLLPDAAWSELYTAFCQFGKGDTEDAG